MKARSRLMLGILLLSLPVTLDGRLYSSRAIQARASGPDRIRFSVVTVEEKAGNRHVISEAVIDGAPGTDFTVNLRAARFKMNARFLTDLVSQDTLKVRARLATRRLYGNSERGLPLYEEDAQDQTLTLGFDEQIVLLPFGRSPDELLKIEITPAVSEQSARLASGKPRPIEINIVEPSAGNAVSVQASKTPHRFDVEASLFEDGVEVARGKSQFLIEEAQELTLQPSDRASAEVAANPLTVNFTVDQYLRSRPVDEAFISFDAHRSDQRNGGKREPVAINWAGAAGLGSDLGYEVSNYYLKSSGKKYELRFKVTLAEGETAY